MAFNITLWRVEQNKIKELSKAKLENENKLETWIVEDPSILGSDILLIGRQVITEFGGRIDLLGIDRQGDVIVIELKRDRTPREIVAQVLDYASWINNLDEIKINEIASNFLGKELSKAFEEWFSDGLPENINSNHKMVIVASNLDDSSERIIHYLSSEYGININAIFFNFFKTGTEEILGRAWLVDPEKVQEQFESKKKLPWTGYWFANIGEGQHRNWEDNVKYGFLAAGQGKKYSDPLKKLKVGDRVFAFLKTQKYLGFGEVTHEAQMAKEFFVESAQKTLFDLPLVQPGIKENSNDPEKSEWIVGVKWLKTFSKENGKWFSGAFANQNIVCKLRDQVTFEYLKKEFEVLS
ncbi:MAG: endonuclease NucS [Fibrobacterota bacterium]|nr:endonuclease NucS [Fibrobacterota bacterium]